MFIHSFMIPSAETHQGVSLRIPYFVILLPLACLTVSYFGFTHYVFFVTVIGTEEAENSPIKMAGVHLDIVHWGQVLCSFSE